MGKDVLRTINASCSDSQAALNVSFDATLILDELQKSIEKRLAKKGIGVQWNDEEAGCDLVVRVIAMEQGSQLLRYILPFISPAILEVGGQVTLDGAAPERFHYVQKAQVGLFGGSAKGMLKVNAQRVGDKIAKEVLRNI
jgi:hypothetical protein